MQSLSILVVDDDPVLRMLLGERLKKAGYVVEVAEDGYVARDLLENRSYDVVLTDLMMPGDIGGIEVLEIAKEKDRSIEVVLITAHSSIDTAVEAMKKGANDYLEKPINFDELFLRLDKIANVQTIYKSAMDLRLALNRTEREAAETIQVLELLSNKLQQSLDDVEKELQQEGLTSDDRITNALTIIAET
ncbi:response regulator [Desulforhopalus sp. 52FAK]